MMIDSDDDRSTASDAGGNDYGSLMENEGKMNKAEDATGEVTTACKDEGDDEDEYNEEVENEYDDRPPKKKRFSCVDFIIDEAEESEDLEDEEELKDGAEDFVDESQASGPKAYEFKSCLPCFGLRWDKQEDEKITEYYRQKYAESTTAEQNSQDEFFEPSEEIAQQVLLPGIKDPNLWMVKCKMGEEKNTAIQLMRKFIAYQEKDLPLQIKSVVAVEGVRGCIYVEAFKLAHVKQAIENVGNLRTGQWRQQLVPIKEMIDVVRVVKEQTILIPKAWVRLKHGLYKGDIAQVDFVDTALNQVHLKLMPRIDFAKLRGTLWHKADEKENKRKRTRKPVGKLFDVNAIKRAGGVVTVDGDLLSFNGNRYSHSGFLYKSFPMSSIIAKGVKPTLSELEKFQDSPEDMNLELAQARLEDQGHNFSIGDLVEVNQGELIHLKGNISNIDGNKITIIPKHEDLKDPLDFQVQELSKHFRAGDYVKVIAGCYQGDAGLIILVEENLVVLCSDLTMNELSNRWSHSEDGT